MNRLSLAVRTPEVSACNQESTPSRRTPPTIRSAAALGALSLALLLSACSGQSGSNDPAAEQKPAVQAPATVEDLPPMPGARPIEQAPVVDMKALERAVAQERALQAREIAAGKREPEQSRPLWPTTPEQEITPAGGEGRADEPAR